MLLNALPGCSTPLAATEPLASEDACVRTETAVPLQNRALLAQLEALAQCELAQLVAEREDTGAALPQALDPALAGLAWDLGLSGDALEEGGKTARLSVRCPVGAAAQGRRNAAVVTRHEEGMSEVGSGCYSGSDNEQKVRPACPSNPP